jgi:hypothetical protein
MDLVIGPPASDTPSAHGPDGAGDALAAPGVTRRLRLSRLAALAGGLFVTGYVAMVDPAEGGAYPICPSRVLLGIDCPFCGGLRGTHDMLHGHVREALDHNLLLPFYLAFIAVAAGLFLLPIVGRPARSVRLPRWVAPATLAVLVAFMVVRNLPIASLHFLRSGA